MSCRRRGLLSRDERGKKAERDIFSDDVVWAGQEDGTFRRGGSTPPFKACL